MKGGGGSGNVPHNWTPEGDAMMRAVELAARVSAIWLEARSERVA